ncbi:MAG: glycosyltransferase [Bacteriovoracaceae bacterium]|nr:glycosyltransferase [Bacteriovoracaceae bacterium]
MRNPTSIIIPTYGRNEDVINQTIDSILKYREELSEKTEIILIDQNQPSLKISEYYEKLDFIQYSKHERGSEYYLPNTKGIHLIHITGGKASVTMAKNYGIKVSTGNFLIFFDDDVIVQKNCLARHHDQFYSKSEAAFIGGREIVHPPSLKRSRFRESLIKLLELFSNPRENEFKFNNRYIGRIKPNSFMLSNFDVDSHDLIRINGARGCNWSTSKNNFQNAGGFDESFQGTALREETDLYLRLEGLGKKGFFDGQAVVHHMRQLGGCENISKSLNSLKSKLENELYFQRKHFSKRSSFYFFVRLLPITLETLKDTRGLSLLLFLKHWMLLFAQRTN